MKRHVPLLPNLITAFGLSCGLFIIFTLNMTPLGEVDERVLLFSAGILLLAAFADLLDGAVARAIHAESEFGGLFDSLADAITFGVAPSVIVLKTLSSIPNDLSLPLMAAAMIYSICGVLRLVRFNVMHTSMGQERSPSEHFTGLPIPAAAASVISLNLLLVSEKLKSFVHLGTQWNSPLVTCAMVALGYLMICRLKFPSLKTLRVRVASFQAVFVFVVSAVFIFYGFFYHFPIVFFSVCWGYVCVALVLSFLRWVSGKRLKQLAEFDPDPEDLEWMGRDDAN